jgi:hypothetical protein
MKADAPHTSRLRIPSWVPKEVADAAREFARRDPPVISPAILKALTTNKRMKRVWRELSKRQGDGYLHRVKALPKRLARPKTAAEWQAAGRVVLFSQAIEIMRAELSRPLPTASREEAETARDAYTTTAINLRSFARTLGYVAAECIPPDYPDPHRVEAFRRLNSEQMRKLEDAAEVLEGFAQDEDEAASEFPDRDRGNASKRRVTGELVKLCRAVFGKDLARTMGTVAGVLLGVPDIPESTIRDWHRIRADKTP